MIKKARKLSDPPIGITMGCPVGIGPEIIAGLLAVGVPFPTVVVGDQLVLERCIEELSVKVEVRSWQPGSPVAKDAINVIPVSRIEQISWGRPDKNTGQAMAQYILEAVRLTKEGQLSAMVTCPITKTGLHLAGFLYPGHTEMLAELFGVSDFAMMMAGAKLRVVLVTVHTNLANVASQLKIEEIGRIIRLTSRALERDLGIGSARIVVAGLNPHAGEGGLFGSEEEEIIIPAIEIARKEGLNVVGPLPPDTVFFRAVAGEFDVVICMYHDQGLIPFKLLHFFDGVNVTLGLPIVRTSVDHGTAYDIAGKGVADPGSLEAALSMAAKMVANRKREGLGN